MCTSGLQNHGSEVTDRCLLESDRKAWPGSCQQEADSNSHKPYLGVLELVSSDTESHSYRLQFRSFAKTHSASYEVAFLHFCSSSALLRSPIMWEAIESSPAVHKVARRGSSLSFVSLRYCVTKCLTDNWILEPHSYFIYSKYSFFCPFTYPSLTKPTTTKVQHFYMTENTFL